MSFLVLIIEGFTPVGTPIKRVNYTVGNMVVSVVTNKKVEVWVHGSATFKLQTVTVTFLNEICCYIA